MPCAANAHLWSIAGRHMLVCLLVFSMRASVCLAAEDAAADAGTSAEEEQSPTETALG
eukprot:SAG11_NODE_26924_length_339_cov_0.695833_1_plen_57_part_01